MFLILLIAGLALLTKSDSKAMEPAPVLTIGPDGAVRLVQARQLVTTGFIGELAVDISIGTDGFYFSVPRNQPLVANPPSLEGGPFASVDDAARAAAVALGPGQQISGSANTSSSTTRGGSGRGSPPGVFE